MRVSNDYSQDVVRFPQRLRPEVQILRTGPASFHLLDPRTQAHYLLDADNRYLLELFAQDVSIDEIISQFQIKFHRPVRAERIREFIGQLSDLDLLIQEPGDQRHDVAEQASASFEHFRSASSDAGINRFFDVLTLLFGWLLHPVWLLVAIPMILLAIAILVRRWDEFYNDSLMLWTRYPFIPLFLASFVQTVFFETLPRSLMLGICCRRFGGRVRRFGLEYGNWVLPTIAFSTDIGESMILMSNRGRRTFIAIGAVIPLTLSAFFIIGWAAGSRASDLYLFWMFMIVPSGLMIAYQCNVFSLFATTHWGLAWAVKDWNLHRHALAETNAWLLGRRSPRAVSQRERFWLRVYGICSYTIRCSIDALLLFGGGYYITRAFGPVGASAFVLLVAWWNRAYLKPIWHASGYSLEDLRNRWVIWRRRRLRAALKASQHDMIQLGSENS